MPGLENIPVWMQLVVSTGLLIGGIILGARGYRDGGRRGAGIAVEGGIVSGRELTPLVEAIHGLAAAIDRRSEQWDERARQEAERAHQSELDGLREKIKDLERRLGA